MPRDISCFYCIRARGRIARSAATWMVAYAVTPRFANAAWTSMGKGIHQREPASIGKQNHQTHQEEYQIVVPA